MATNKADISVTQLDFDYIKQNLINYMKADPTFQDYAFEGSALNIMMDVLAYNTHMNAVIANMAANEMFIDSAQLRASVVSLAKAIGYTPRSKRTAQAEISLSFTDIPGFPTWVTVPAGTRFNTPNGIIFSTKEQYLAYPKVDGNTGEYYVDEVLIFEGYYNSFSYTVDVTKDQRYIVPSVDADITTLRVTVTEGATITEYFLNENITLADSASKIYFLQETPSGEFEVTFGDGILGFKPVNGSTVKLSYIISKYGEDANNANIFQKAQAISGWFSYTISTSIVAYGAAAAESLESIRSKAPMLYKSQNRAVVTEDYENFMIKEYPWIESMSIWGGEYNEPPTYGKIFIAIKPKHTDFLSNSLKESIKNNLIRKYNVVTIIPEIIDPEYLYMQIKSTVQYSVTSSTSTAGDIVNFVSNAIAEYFDDNTTLFNKPFYSSKLVSYIDNAENSIANSVTDLTMMKRFFPSINAGTAIEIKFYNAIKPGTVKSSSYNISGVVGNTAKQFILDDGLGTLYTRSALTNEIIHNNVGSVDYTKGSMDLNVTVYEVPPDTQDLRIYCTPANVNIIPGYNQIILLDTAPAKLEYGRPAGVSVIVSAENKDYK